MPSDNDAKKRILILSFLEPWSIAPSQGAPSLHETLAGYAQAGWAVDYVTFWKRPLLGVAHEQSITTDIVGVEVHRFHIPIWQWLPPILQAKIDRLLLFPLFALPITLRLLRTQRPIVFYAYEASAILTGCLVRLVRPKRQFFVHRIQGVSVLGESYRKKLFMFRKIESLLSLRARADAYIMTDDGTKGDEVWRHWNRSVNGANLLHIRNGISSQLLAPKISRQKALATFGLNPFDQHILMLSRLDPIKRVDRGLLAFSALRETHPSARLLIAGDGEQRGALEEMARELGITDQVRFLGGLDRSAVSTALQCADIFLSLYDFSNCGNPLFEALAHRLPIITLDNGSTSSVIRHGHNGLLLSVDDSDSLIDALKALLEDTAARERLSRGADTWLRENLISWADRMNREVEWLSHKIAH